MQASPIPPAPIDRNGCERLDLTDPLARFRSEFLIPEGLVYLDGNSLGAMPRVAAERADQVVSQEWGRDLIRSWNSAGWFDLPQRLGDMLAPVIGAAPGEVLVTDSTGVNLFKLLWAAAELRPGRRRIILEGSNFPTDNYVAQGLAAARGDGLEIVLVEKDGIADAIDGDTAAICITHVHYKTGHIHDMAGLTARAHAAGALAVWDLCHSAGALPVDLNAAGADFAVGCTYHYLNGGPGSPAFLFVARRHQDAAAQPLTGWWSHAEPFAFEPRYRPHEGIRRFLTGTQPMVRAKSMALTDLFIRLVEERCAGAGFVLASPREAAIRGSQVALRHPQGYPIMRALIERGVIGDFRAPDIMRFGFAPLYIGYADVWDAVDRLADIMATEAWREARHQSRDAVT
jgi:kynureninase